MRELRDEERVKKIFILRVRVFNFFLNIIYVYGSGSGWVCIIPKPDSNPFRVFIYLLLKPKPATFASPIG